MIAGGGANLKKSSNSKKALVNGLFGGGSNAEPDAEEAAEVEAPRTLHQMRGVTPQNIMSLLDEDTREDVRHGPVNKQGNKEDDFYLP